MFIKISYCKIIFTTILLIQLHYIFKSEVFSLFLNCFLLLFKYSCLHFSPTAPPHPSHPHLPLWILVPFGFFHVSFIHVLFSFGDRGREGERERNINMWEKNQLVASYKPPTRDLTCNPFMYPDWDSNWWPFAFIVWQYSTNCGTLVRAISEILFAFYYTLFYVTFFTKSKRKYTKKW